MENKEKILFTSESVTEGHPDKICDAISDAILDALVAQDPMSRVACETATTTGLVLIMGEITSQANIDIQSMNTRTSKQGIATMVVTFEIGGRNELTAMIDKLRMIENVIDIERTTG